MVEEMARKKRKSSRKNQRPPKDKTSTIKLYTQYPEYSYTMSGVSSYADGINYAYRWDSTGAPLHSMQGDGSDT